LRRFVFIPAVLAGRPRTCALAQFLLCPCFYEDSVAGNTERFRAHALAFSRQLQALAAKDKAGGDDIIIIFFITDGQIMVVT
jgi:hypothetical protein